MIITCPICEMTIQVEPILTVEQVKPIYAFCSNCSGKGQEITAAINRRISYEETNRSAETVHELPGSGIAT